jgi:hypothetical protein
LRTDSPNVIDAVQGQGDSSLAPVALADRCRSSIRDCEAVLRDVLGLSRREAKALVSGGWASMTKGDSGAGDETPEAAVLSALERFRIALEGRKNE